MINWKRAWWLYFQSKQKGHHNNVNTNWSAVNTLSKNFPTMPHPGFDYLFAALSWKFILSQTHVGLTKMKTCSTTIFPSPQDNIFLLLKINLLSETRVYLFKFSNNNSRMKFKVNNRSTRRSSGVFIANFEYIWHVVLVFCFVFCWLWICKCRMEYFIA